MRRILVVHASTHGQTRAIAERVADELERDGHAVDLGDATTRLPPPEDYDAVVIGSRVQNSKHHPAIAAYVVANRDALAAMPTAFFSVSMSAAQRGAGADPHDYMAKFFDETGWRPGCATAFGGALKYRQYGWLLRQVMRWLARRGGHATDTTRDHVYTDWTAVMRFARHVSDGVVGAVPDPTTARTTPIRPPAPAGTAR